MGIDLHSEPDPPPRSAESGNSIPRDPAGPRPCAAVQAVHPRGSERPGAPYDVLPVTEEGILGHPMTRQARPASVQTYQVPAETDGIGAVMLAVVLDDRAPFS